MKTVFYTQRVDVIESYQERRDCADQRIAQFLHECGFLPLPLPNNEAVARAALAKLSPDGIVLTGGNSLVSQGGNAPERDATDRYLIEAAVAGGIPLYGFCRGMQSILDFFGEELVPVVGHVAVRTMLSGAKDPLLGDFSREVNSYHNQGCLKISNGDLEELARSADGVVKAVRHRKYRLLGTMWHPERERPFSEKDLDMVRNFFN